MDLAICSVFRRPQINLRLDWKIGTFTTSNAFSAAWSEELTATAPDMMDLISVRILICPCQQLSLKTTVVTWRHGGALPGRHRTVRASSPVDWRQLCGLCPCDPAAYRQAWLSARCICTGCKRRRWASPATPPAAAASSRRNCSSSHLSWRRGHTRHAARHSDALTPAAEHATFATT